MSARLSIGDQAAALGHLVGVRHEGKRFVLICLCGWESKPTWSRQVTYTKAGQHCIEVVRVGEPLGVSAQEQSDFSCRFRTSGQPGR